MKTNLPVDPARIAADIDGLAALTEPDRPWTRRAFTPMFLEGRSFLETRMREAGLETRIDAAGNLVGRRAGARPGLGAIMVGSHSDTVPSGGRYDGIAGVAAGLEVARALDAAGVTLDHDLEVVDFLGEEVTIFGVSCVGSRGMAGLVPEAWLARRDAQGRDLPEGIAMVGGDAARLAGATRSDVKAFLELHIEQGPVLEAERVDIGIVSAIAGITRLEIVVDGRADHAGTTPMGARADALVAASRIVGEIRALARGLAASPEHFAATVGEFTIEPGAANIVPSRARMLVDARAENRATMEIFCARVASIAAEVAAAEGVTIAEPTRVSDAMPTPLDPLVVETLAAAADAVGATRRPMASGAGHDTGWMARIAKAGMIFVPCAGGRSHAPEESAEIADIALGAAVLTDAVVRLDRSLQTTTET
ncbi:Zn-dependent hydrolase [Salinarimonas ramus]|uniref:Zn-dependent hydrolase n=1 Tax=Salinarimonas ramus TaxID=690164 RepID=A0A917Q7L9_9HYPH|nr:Zn-dependent hydrolase [Salinarimonas ramus]GGK28092.1 Zn-dependent hydrolase [Salinarimonas ramus]